MTGLINVRALLAARPSATTWAERRAAFQALAERLAPPNPWPVQPVDAGGVPALWLRPPGASPNHIILYLHGGAFVLGSAAAYAPLAGRIAAACGATALVVDYRLAPEHTFPAAPNDALAAYRFAAATGAAVAVAGDSCGANLALGVALSAQSPRPAALGLISPYLDLTHSGASFTARQTRDPFIRPQSIAACAQAYLAGANPRAPLASPLFANLAGLPPVCVQVGTEEVLFDDAARLAGTLAAAEVPVVFEPYPDMIHIFPFFAALLPEGEAAAARLGAFLGAHLRRQCPL